MSTLAMEQTVAIPNAQTIPAQTHAEAGHLAAVELDRLLAMIDEISDESWENPTDCSLWNVRQMVAHLAGACAGHTSLAEFKRQYISNPLNSEFESPIDAVNNLQVADRLDRTIEEIIEELREEGPKAIRVRQRIPWFIRNVWLPLGPLGLAPIGYLTDTIYTRDWWMHRADLCHATGQHMHLTPEHDGRIIALVLRDLARKRARNRETDTIDLILTDDIELIYRFGSKSRADATIRINLIEFNRLASGRLKFEKVITAAEFSGNTAVAHKFLRNCEIPY
jgi:uncharacterized protein (TIGR03083 family)